MPNPITFFDSHCHFDFSAFDADRKSLWQTCKTSGVTQLIIPGVAPEQWEIAAQLSEIYEGVFYAAGIHPWWIPSVINDELNTELLEKIYRDLRTTLRNAKCVAVGECGLDASIKVPMPIQQEILDVHLQLAYELRLPIILHCRKAHNELILQLKKYNLPAGGVIHAFSGSIDLANTYWSLGLRLGIGGSITYERAHKTRATVKQLAIEAIVLETDAPDMPLNGQQGQRNSPEYIPMIAQTLATIRHESLEYIAQQTTHNARVLFGIM